MRCRSIVTSALCVLALAAASMASGCGEAQAPPSLLLVTIDTLRADRVGCYGYEPARTPHMDRLAERGVLFERARTHVPLTLPAHASLLTGRLPPRHGVRGNGLFRLAQGVPTLAQSLRDSGYSTMAVVSSVVLDRTYGLNRGFEVYDDNQRVGSRARFDYNERGADQISEAFEAQISGLEPPFFAWVHFYDPHLPWVREPDASLARDAYDEEISFADEGLGRVLEAARSHTDRLIVAVTSDHGESLGEHGENQHGYTLHRGVLRVPLIMAGDGLPTGTVIEDDVSLVDLTATLADLAGVELLGIDGESLAPRVAGKPWAGKPIWEETLHPLYDAGWAPMRGILEDQWHFVSAPRPELYDRATDPADENNVFEEHPEIAKRLQEQLSEWGERMGDEPEPPVDESAVDEEQLARLASLGYLTAGASGGTDGERLDPKDGLPSFLAIERAEELFARREPARAVELLTARLDVDPLNPRLWQQAARGYTMLGQLESALDASERALALDPHSDFVRITRAIVLKASGRFDQAEAELERVLEINPRHAEAAIGLASLLEQRGRPTEALEVLRQLEAEGIFDPDAGLRLAAAALDASDPVQARRRFEQVVQMDPDRLAVLASMGRALIAQGRVESARVPLSVCSERRGPPDCSRLLSGLDGAN